MMCPEKYNMADRIGGVSTVVEADVNGIFVNVGKIVGEVLFDGGDLLDRICDGDLPSRGQRKSPTQVN